MTLTLLRRSQWANWVRRPVATRVNDEQQRLEPKLQIRYQNLLSLVRKAASTVDLNFPSQVHLRENDAWSKAVSRSSILRFPSRVYLCEKDPRVSQKRATTVRAPR